MKTSRPDRPPSWVALAVMLALAAGLIGVPARVRAPMRGGLAAVLRPGQLTTLVGVDASRTAVAWVEAASSGARAIARLEATVDELRDENRQLKLELVMVDRDQADATGGADGLVEGDPLLVPSLVRARVLGEDAVGALERRKLLAIGANQGVEPDSLVLDAPAPIVDQGREEGVGKNDPVLAGRAVVGRVSSTGSSASAIQLVTDSQFRAQVRLMSVTDATRSQGLEGVLEGVGKPLCRVRHVNVTEPVAVGDLVYGVGGQGVLPHPLLFGEVVRAEAGSRFWEIWVKPAADLGQLQSVMVLRTELNPNRVAKEKADRVVR